MDNLSLVRPAPEWEAEFYDMNEELRDEGRSRPYENFNELLQELAANEDKPENPKHVPMSVYWLANGRGRLLGEL